MSKKEREELIEKEQKARCSNEIHLFTKVCALESAIHNGCSTCPFKPFKDSIDVIVIENVQPVYPTLEVVGPTMPLMAFTNNWNKKLNYYMFK